MFLFSLVLKIAATEFARCWRRIISALETPELSKQSFETLMKHYSHALKSITHHSSKRKEKEKEKERKERRNTNMKQISEQN